MATRVINGSSGVLGIGSSGTLILYTDLPLYLDCDRIVAVAVGSYSGSNALNGFFVDSLSGSVLHNSVAFGSVQLGIFTWEGPFNQGIANYTARGSTPALVDADVRFNASAIGHVWFYQISGGNTLDNLNSDSGSKTSFSATFTGDFPGEMSDDVLISLFCHASDDTITATPTGASYAFTKIANVNPGGGASSIYAFTGVHSAQIGLSATSSFSLSGAAAGILATVRVKNVDPPDGNLVIS